MTAVDASSQTPVIPENKEGPGRHNHRDTAAHDGHLEADAPAAPAAGRPLPCLSSNNCTEGEGEKLHQLTGGHRRMAYVLAHELKHLVEFFGIERCGFLTLTFGDKHAPCLKEVQRRFHSLRTHVLSDRYERGIFVVERGETRSRLHLHGVVVVGSDIRTGFDFEAVMKRDYRSARPAIRSEWAFWRRTAPKYGFGRTELLPVRSTAEGIARYVGSYIKKQILHRIGADKGARLIRFMNYGPGDRKASSRLAWNSDRAWIWRQKVEAWARLFGMCEYDQIAERCGPRWAYVFGSQILGMELDSSTIYPSQAAAVESSRQWIARQATGWNAKMEAERESPWRAGRTFLLDPSYTGVKHAW